MNAYIITHYHQEKIINHEKKLFKRQSKIKIQTSCYYRRLLLPYRLYTGSSPDCCRGCFRFHARPVAESAAASVPVPSDYRVLLPWMRRYKGSQSSFKRTAAPVCILSPIRALYCSFISVFYDYTDHRTRQPRKIYHRHALPQPLSVDRSRSYYGQLSIEKYSAPFLWFCTVITAMNYYRSAPGPYMLSKKLQNFHTAQSALQKILPAAGLTLQPKQH